VLLLPAGFGIQKQQVAARNQVKEITCQAAVVTYETSKIDHQKVPKNYFYVKYKYCECYKNYLCV
jgi:hypothetical protein